MSFKPEVEVVNEPGKFYSNNLAFATYAEALYSARDLMNRWLLVTDCRTVESDQEVNYKIDLLTGVMNEVPKAHNGRGELGATAGAEAHAV